LQVAERGAITPEHCELARRLALIGLDDQRIAAALGIAESTLTTWKKKSPNSPRQSIPEKTLRMRL
jgi:hypothetical protein